MKSLDTTIYRLVMEDAYLVIEKCFNKEQQDALKRIPPDKLQDYLSRKLDISWTEEIECCLMYLYHNLEDINE